VGVQVSAGIAHQLTLAEAIKLVKGMKAGTRFYAMMRVDSPVVDKPDRVFPRALVAGVPLSRPGAIKLLKGLHSEGLEARGGRIPLTEYAREECGSLKAYTSIYIG
jgi:hypothetical protein